MKLMGNMQISIIRPQKHKDKNSGNTPRQPAVELIDPAHAVSVFWFPCDNVHLFLGLTTFSNSLQLLTSADTARKLVMERQINIFLLLQLLLSRQTHHYTREQISWFKINAPFPPSDKIYKHTFNKWLGFFFSSDKDNCIVMTQSIEMNRTDLSMQK